MPSKIKTESLPKTITERNSGQKKKIITERNKETMVREGEGHQKKL